MDVEKLCLGFSGIRAPDDKSFEFFCTEYHRQQNQLIRLQYSNSGNDFKCRLSGNLRKALEWYKVPSRHSDSHVYRELAYIYAFEHSFDDAHRCITKAHELVGNPYILDILAMVLLGRYRTEGSSVSIKAYRRLPRSIIGSRRSRRNKISRSPVTNA